MISSPLIDRLIALSLEEDLIYGDVTTDLTVPSDRKGSALIVACERFVVCGLPLIERIAELARVRFKVELYFEEGQIAKRGDSLAKITGSLASILSLERTILNFIQRTSGIASHTRSIASLSKHLLLLDTRKTTPGWRLLEKYAVRTGGAHNHRTGLGDMILVKNNHFDANGGDVAETLAAVYANRAPYIPVEVEIRNEAELLAALPFRPDIIMLDNMTDAQIKRAIKVVRDCAGYLPCIEVSGRITPERIAKLEALGVDAASMSAMCGAARTVDISLRIQPSR